GSDECLVCGVEHCAATRNTVTVTGTPQFGGGSNVTDTDTDTVTVLTAGIHVTKVCSTVRNADGTVTVSYNGTVSNTGTAALSGVTVQDNKGGSPISIGTLAAGASLPYSSSYNLPASTPCDSDVTDTVTATGTVADTTLCAAVANRSVSDTASATCHTPPCPPSITVLKEVACVGPNG